MYQETIGKLKLKTIIVTTSSFPFVDINDGQVLILFLEIFTIINIFRKRKQDSPLYRLHFRCIQQGFICALGQTSFWVSSPNEKQIENLQFFTILQNFKTLFH